MVPKVEADEVIAICRFRTILFDIAPKAYGELFWYWIAFCTKNNKATQTFPSFVR